MYGQAVTDALQVMDELMAHPITTIFHNPIDPANAPDGYFTRIRNPRDLKDIRQLLSNSKFASVSEWAEDVELVWRNCEDFYGTRSFMGIAAQASRKLFQKIRSQIEEKTMKPWCAEISRLRNREAELVAKCPGKVHGAASGVPNFRQFQEILAIQYFPERELSSFVAATKKITSDMNLRQMVRIVKEMQPKLDVGNDPRVPVWFDVTHLTVPTFLALQEYVKALFEELGMEFPTETVE
jgi:hypothetical protein